MDYLPIFTKETDELHARNDKKIKEFMALPFWKKWGRHESLRQEIINSWRNLPPFTG